MSAQQTIVTLDLEGVLVPEIALYATDRPEFLLLRRPSDDAAMLHYRFLNRRVLLPLHPTWAQWLWERALRAGEARLLESRGMEAYRCAPDEASLSTDLTEAIQQRTLGFPAEDVGRPDHPAMTSPVGQEIRNGAP